MIAPLDAHRAATKRTQRPARTRRGGPFRIGDLVLAVAVLAIAFAWTRAYWGQVLASVPSWSWASGVAGGRARHYTIGGDPLYNSARGLSALLLVAGATLASAGSVALVIARRWHHRAARTPLWRARRPGALACLLTVAALLGTLAWQAVRPSHLQAVTHLFGPWYGEVRVIASPPGMSWGRIGDERPVPDPLRTAPLCLPRWLGFAIGGAWLRLRASGAWRAEGSTLDRLGRVVGAYWIVAAVYFLVFPL